MRKIRNSDPEIVNMAHKSNNTNSPQKEEAAADLASGGGPHNHLQQVDEDELIRLVQVEAMQLPDLGLAVSGMAGRFPKSSSVLEFEANLRDGRDMVNDKDEARFTCGLWGLPPRAGRLNELSKFDNEFFGFSQDEANFIDLQLRILYEVVYESILDAGVNPAELRGSKTGVFFGLHCNEFENAMADDPAFKTSGYYAQFAVKVAQYFDLRGLTVTFDAACASGFVGLHNAVEALSCNLIDQAIVCSSNIPIHPTGSFIFLQMQMLSPTGYSRFLDSRADGYVKSEACVSVLLQRKHLARRNYCSIMATMTSVDGYKREGITFPSDRSQERLICAAKELAGLSTNHVEYLEAHGTGTPAGDPQEARAISNVYYWRKQEAAAATTASSGQLGQAESGNSEETSKPGNEELAEEADGQVFQAQDELEEDEQMRELRASYDSRKIGPLLVGSVKTNMGHSEAASGLCALVKVALMFENEIIYKSLHFDQPNTNIEALMDGRLKFVDANMPLRAKIVPLSCYGFGGSNVHAIVRANERPSICEEPRAAHRKWPRLVLMFGRSEFAVNEFFDKMLAADSSNHYLSEDFFALLDALSAGKIDRLMSFRGFMVVDEQSGRQLARAVRRCDLEPAGQVGDLREEDIGRRTHFQEVEQRKCNLVFAGVGCEWRGMASGLQEFDLFWNTIERLGEMLAPFQVNLISLLLASDGAEDEEDALGVSMCSTFVSIVAYQIALVNILKRKLRLDRNGGSIVGHSLGEIACAYAAGLFDERETIMVAYQLGQTLDENKHLIRGKMVALGLSQEETLELLAGSASCESLRVCCVNGPNSVTVSGRKDEVDAFCAPLEARTFVHEVNGTIALHNEQIMGPEIKAKLKEALERVLLPLTNYNRINTSWISSFVEESDELGKQADVEYFSEMLCKQVDFLAALEQLEDSSIALEIGPANLFESQISQIVCANKRNKFFYVNTMRRKTEQEKQTIELLSTIGQLYQMGAKFNLAHLYSSDDANSLFPVRRQTPSIGSIFKWNHSEDLFVPRYPIQFSKSSAKSEMPVDLVQDRDKYLAGHCVEGRVLFPATGYLFLMWRVFSFTKRKIYDACFQDVERELVPVEFRNVRLLRAVILGNRSAQLYSHFEEATGRFEIREGGSVVVEGYAFTPQEKPNELLYEDVRRRIEGENLEFGLEKDDVYKQFRVSGYDYGETFRCIEGCSYDGRRSRVKFNGHFISLTDSILQSIFLAVTQYAPSGGLFLPTRFEYVRFQPEAILAKVHAAKMPLDLMDGSLNTKAKREIMSKMLQRREGAAAAATGQAGAEQTGAADETEAAAEKKPDCIFETFCDPVTGVIITDGIEMRGIKASPAPRRVDTNEVLLESYKFVSDFEQPVVDEQLTKFEQVNRQYASVCNSMALQLLAKVCAGGRRSDENGLPEQFAERLIGSPADGQLVSQEQIKSYMAKHLECVHENANCEKTTETKPDEAAAKKETNETGYDIKRNGPRTLMSVLDQLAAVRNVSPKLVKEFVLTNRLSLMRDLIQSSFTAERFMRPLVEIVLENVCTKKSKLKLIEINLDDGILRAPLQSLVAQLEPSLALDYSIAHPEPSRLSAADKSAGGGGATIKTHTLRDLQSLFTENHLRELDLIVYKDISCYSLPKQVLEQNGLAPLLGSLNEALALGGYCLIAMRNKLTLAERILLALSEPELIGINKQDLDELTRTMFSCKAGGSEQVTCLRKIEKINSILSSRCELMLAEAKQIGMLCVSTKSDLNGCQLMLFRRLENKDKTVSLSAATDASEILPLLVRHSDDDNQLEWLERLKANFGAELADAAEQKQQDLDDDVDDDCAADQLEGKAPATRKLVWLCGVATRAEPANGVIGMMQALRKELGSANLRCFYDEFTFRDYPNGEKLELNQILSSATFKEALRRNQLWNCVDSAGNWGSFRHLTVNESLAPSEYLCANELECADATSSGQVGAFVNVSNRGDLSSFAWYEAPHKYLSAEQQSQLVDVAYSALNFRDVMLATGRLPLDAIPIRLASSECLIGLEFSGIDSRGKRVTGMIGGAGIATRVLCPPRGGLVIEIPDWMSLREAATVPCVYATAVMAIVYRGRAKRGESVLVHAASGGVGQAALRLANHLGLEVFATVGSESKKQFIVEEFNLKAERVFNSRDCNFEHEIMSQTRGKGVDMVLNSLADDKLHASIRCLADGGRFLEIGKYDMSIDSQFELLKLDTNKTFHGILLDKLFDSEDASEAFKLQLNCVLQTLRAGLESGWVKPIKSQVFKRNEIEQAFRFMATGKHVGKVLIDIQADRLEAQTGCLTVKAVPRFHVSAEKSYLVTGGLGGFGLELAKWLVSQGARHLVLSSRTGLRTGYQKATLRRLQQASGVEILLVTQSVADATQLEGARKLCELARNFAPSRKMGAIFHLAMVLRDTLLEKMSLEDFREVCKPKVATCVNLDKVLEPNELDYFVAFSSITSGKGNAGQSNYAYANSCLERVCESRRRRGEHALAVQWGAVGDVGVAFENLGGNDVVLGGTRPQRIHSCLATLGRLVPTSLSTCLSVVPVRRNGHDSGSERGDLVAAIMHVLGIKDPSKVGDDATLGDLGLDSLMAVEIRQYIEREYEMTLNIQEIRSLTIAKIREINDKPRAAVKQSGAAKDADQVRQVDSYANLQDGGKTATEAPQQKANGKLADKAAKGQQKEVAAETAGAAAKAAGKSIEALLDKRLVSTFVPRLELPKEDFCRLNYKRSSELARLSSLGPQNRRPIFFVPPIHGSFDRLELVCSRVKRPCVGLNWTRKLGCVQTVAEAVDVYLELLRAGNWRRELLQTSDSDGELVVDLVGYSYGATIAFEMMLKLCQQQQTGAAKWLRAGQLVLLDGSPRQIELGSQYLASLTRKKPLKLGEKIDELLMVYLIAHTRKLGLSSQKLDFVKLQRQLKEIGDVEKKVKFASRKLAKLLAAPQEASENGSGATRRGGSAAAAAASQEEIAHAMEAFCRRYELVNNYKVHSSLPIDCTLIRAEKVYLKSGAGDQTREAGQTHAGESAPAEQQFNKDLDLSSVVEGKVHLHVMPGDHETFLNMNHRAIGEIITKTCRSS